MRTGTKTFGSQDILQDDIQILMPDEAPEKGIVMRMIIDIAAVGACAAGIVFFILRFLSVMEAMDGSALGYIRIGACVFIVYFCTVMMVVRAEHLALDREVRNYRRYIKRSGAVSLEQMAEDFDVDKVSLRHDLELLVKKRMLRNVTVDHEFVSYHR